MAPQTSGAALPWTLQWQYGFQLKKTKTKFNADVSESGKLGVRSKKVSDRSFVTTSGVTTAGLYSVPFFILILQMIHGTWLVWLYSTTSFGLEICSSPAHSLRSARNQTTIHTEIFTIVYVPIVQVYTRELSNRSRRTSRLH